MAAGRTKHWFCAALAFLTGCNEIQGCHFNLTSMVKNYFMTFCSLVSDLCYCTTRKKKKKKANLPRVDAVTVNVEAVRSSFCWMFAELSHQLLNHMFLSLRSLWMKANPKYSLVYFLSFFLFIWIPLDFVPSVFLGFNINNKNNKKQV